MFPLRKKKQLFDDISSFTTMFNKKNTLQQTQILKTNNKLRALKWHKTSLKNKVRLRMQWLK